METTTVHTQHAACCEELKAQIAAHRNDLHPDTTPGVNEEKMDEVVLERLRELGYIE
ncbi:MAG: hypothetical protein IH987_18280 [Planctomycetes bacterium]|nr:hypothetical protein [Planctomycetota bacterium]